MMPLVSLSISALALMASGMTAYTADRSLEFNRHANEDMQRTTLFSQFQSQYGRVVRSLPPQTLDKDFRPLEGSDEYNLLENYWQFIFAQWFATHRVNPTAFKSLWTGFYEPIVADGLEVPSLRYVLHQMILSNRPQRGDWGPFLLEVSRIAHDTHHPLSREAEARLGELKNRGVGQQSPSIIGGADAIKTPR